MIPDYQSLMLPLLKLLGDRQEHKVRDIIENLAMQFQLTEEERKTLGRRTSRRHVVPSVGTSHGDGGQFELHSKAGLNRDLKRRLHELSETFGGQMFKRNFIHDDAAGRS